jgi:uncharacterized SAM-binding protein YcdF (DUF218 family)
MIKSIKTLLFLVILAVVPVLFADVYIGNGFLEKFLREQSLIIMALVLIAYIAIAIFIKKNNFDGKVKKNLTFIVAIFVVQFFLIAATPKEVTSVVIPFTLKFLKTLNFTAYIYFLYRISNEALGKKK